MFLLKRLRMVVIAGACSGGALALLGCAGRPVGQSSCGLQEGTAVQLRQKSHELPEQVQSVASDSLSPAVDAMVGAGEPGFGNSEAAAGTDFGEPIIVCDDPVYDAGTFWVDALPYIRHEFRIKNIGTGTGWVVVVPAFSGTRIKPCFRIKPGGVLRLPIKLATGGLARSRGGKFSKVITVRLVPPPVFPHCRACGHPKHWHEKPCAIRPDDVVMP